MPHTTLAPRFLLLFVLAAGLLAADRAARGGVLSLRLDSPCAVAGSKAAATVAVNPCRPIDCNDLDFTEVTLSSSNTQTATVPAMVIVDRRMPATEQFLITTKNVATPRTVVIRATSGATFKEVTLSVLPASALV